MNQCDRNSKLHDMSTESLPETADTVPTNRIHRVLLKKKKCRGVRTHEREGCAHLIMQRGNDR